MDFLVLRGLACIKLESISYAIMMYFFPLLEVVGNLPVLLVKTLCCMLYILTYTSSVFVKLLLSGKFVLSSSASDSIESCATLVNCLVFA